MFFIYSLNLEDLTVKLYDFSRTKDGVNDLLDTVARNFIRHEHGERAAQNPYRDDTADGEITEDCMFLRHSPILPQHVDVYQRKTTVLQGRVWNSYDVSCKKIMHFSVTEAALGLPIECTGRGVTKKEFSTSLEEDQHAKHMVALSEALEQRRQKIEKRDRELNDVEVQPLLDSGSDCESSSDSELGNPVVKMRRLIDSDSRYSLPPPPSPSPVPPPPPPPMWGCPARNYESPDEESDYSSEYSDSFVE